MEKPQKPVILFDVDGTLIDSNKLLKKRLLHPFAFFHPSLIHQSVFPDVVPTVTMLYQTYSLGIWSQSFDWYQRYKIRSAKLNTYFMKSLIFISLNKMQLLDDIYKKIGTGKFIIVDNSVNIVSSLRARKIQAYCIQRETNGECKHDWIFSSLHQLLKRNLP